MSSSAITPPSSPPPAKRQRTDKENTPTNDNTTTSKINEMTKPLFSPTTPTTPPKSHFHASMPPKPKAQRSRSTKLISSDEKSLSSSPPTQSFSYPRSDQPAFPGDNMEITNDLDPIQFPGPLQNPLHSSLKLIYKDQGVIHNVFQQPLGSKSCWAYSLAMLLTDIIRKEKSLNIDESFWGWFQKAELLNAENVQQKASEIGVSLELTKIPRDNSLEHIRKKIEDSGFPVLTAIDHPVFSGHVIVVDKVTNEKTTIRDPYSRQVFVIPNETMKVYYAAEGEAEIEMSEEQNCLSVTKQPSN